jgi:hypothetical protein
MQFAKTKNNWLVCRRVIIINIITSGRPAAKYIFANYKRDERLTLLTVRNMYTYTRVYIYIFSFFYKLVMWFVFYECLRVTSLILRHENSH